MWNPLTLQALLMPLQVGLLLILETRVTLAHGILLDPPSRSSIWRDPRFPSGTVPANHNDTQLFCGGYQVQFIENGGMCGVCGDSFSHPHPRPNEAGGIYAQGVIVRTYQLARPISVIVKLTANHLGFYKFKLCPNNDITREVTQACLDRHQLKVLNRSKKGKRHISDRYVVDRKQYGDHEVTLLLPPGLTCSQCVLQWTYVTGHSWGCDADGTCDIGRGNQEHFVNCADIAITADRDPNMDNSPLSVDDTRHIKTVKSAATTTTFDPKDFRAIMSFPTPTTTSTVTPREKKGCRGVGEYAGQDRVDVWCRVQCAVGYCPNSHCVCY